MSWTVCTLPKPDRCTVCGDILVVGDIGAHDGNAEHAHLNCALQELRHAADERLEESRSAA